MKERPILFSGAMVRALLDGSKTQTRRIVKAKPSDECPKEMWPHALKDIIEWREQKGRWFGLMGWRSLAFADCPYGHPGDHLWVRETWAQPTTLDPGPTFYRADYPACVPPGFENVPPADTITWKPSIHMPRAASRITLEVTGVRVERLRDISEADALAEGVEVLNGGGYRQYETGAGCYPAAASFRSLWRKINGEDSWDMGPWVWVVEFRRAV
ncbi:hypothetical protein P3T40_003457 [Paraburkholderia sp. EB58]|uniref:hypothetical protein n=1 Tax=Paraburkholderia sp. EB58 TaxID=3035125 RepID=UPI003D20FC00